VCEQSAPIRGDETSQLVDNKSRNDLVEEDVNVESGDAALVRKKVSNEGDKKVDDQAGIKRVKRVDDVDKEKDDTEEQVDDNDDDDDDFFNSKSSLSHDSLLKLRHDVSIRSVLRDSRLQAIFRQIDKASDRGAALSDAKKKYGRDFTRVLDKMLVAVGAATEEERGIVTFVGLQSSHVETLKKSLEVRQLAEMKIAKVTEVVLKDD